MRDSARYLALICLLILCALSSELSAQIVVKTANPSSVSVVVGSAPPNARKVPDTIFGSFLEPIGDSINHGLSAEILTNPSLEGGLWNHTNLEKMFTEQPELISSSNGFGLPLPWEPLDRKAGRRFALHFGDAANTWQSVELMGVPGFDVGIKQRVYLPVQRTLDYNVSFYAKHLQGSSQITVLLLSHDTEKALAQAKVRAVNSVWTKYSAKLTLQAGAVQPLQQVDFAVKVADDERVDVDEFSLMPQDAVDGLDPDVIALSKAMGMTELRLAGNFSSYYDWRDGIGPLDRRLTMENIAWGIPEYNKFGTDEFLAFCKMVHAVPQFGLNMGSGTPLEAADWVRYIRQHYKGKVIYELGNELYGKWQVGWVPVDQIAARTLAFSKAVRSVDPNAEIIATGGMPQSFEKWNGQQLSNPPGTFNYLSTHFIRRTNEVALSGASDDFMAAAAYALPFAVGHNFQRMHAQVDAVPGYSHKVHFAITEWLFSSRGKGERVFTNQSPNSKNEGGAIMVAGVFNTLIRTIPIVSISDMTGLMEFAGIWKRREQVYVTPSYYVFRMYSSVKGNMILPVKTDSGTYDVHGGVQGFENMAGIPYIDVVATMSPDGKSMTLFCINRDLAKDTPVRIDPGAFHHGGMADVQQLKAASRYEVNDEVHPQQVIPTSSTLTVSRTGPFTYTLPHESVTMIRLRADTAASQ